jgi:FixJ family two-component response regulator
MSISEGLQMAQQADVDIILLDDLLPDGSGLDFLSRMEALEIEKPVLAINGHGNKVVASRMIKSGAYGYLSKIGTNQAVLLHSIKTALKISRLKKEMAHPLKFGPNDPK